MREGDRCSYGTSVREPLDWNDATNEGREANLARLSPEEVKKLRAVMAPRVYPKRKQECGPGVRPGRTSRVPKI